MQLRVGFWIPTEVKFGGKPYFPHGLSGIYVSKRSRVGANCIIFHQVTIGSNTLIDSSGLGAPVIGDRCYIGVGAKIIGGITIGNDVRIAANAVVTKNVPDGCTVVGVNDIRPARGKTDNRYYREVRDGWEALDGEKTFAVPAEQQHKLDAAFKNPA